MSTLHLLPNIPLLLILLLLLRTLLTHANPLTPTLQPLLSTTTNVTFPPRDPYCFTQISHPGIGPTNPLDCREALRKLVAEPHFSIPIAFSKNIRRGIKVPRGWQSGACVIFVSCANDHDMEFLTLRSVAAIAVRVISMCIDGVAPEEMYGGLGEVGEVGTFYVSVGKPARPTPAPSGSVGGVQVMELGSGVGNETLVEAALMEFEGGDYGVAES